MFTGLIQQTGTVENLVVKKNKGTLIVCPKIPFKNIQTGESIAVDGCCLTVVERIEGAVREPPLLAFDLSKETLRKTTIRYYKKGTLVNLERALKVGDRMGGHFVLGHVDGVGEIKSVKRHQGSLEMKIVLPDDSLLIDKGSIAIDGVSLTICNPKKGEFTVFIVPHTEKMTNLGHKKPGDFVNLEMDILGKYVQSLILQGHK